LYGAGYKKIVKIYINGTTALTVSKLASIKQDRELRGELAQIQTPISYVFKALIPTIPTTAPA